MQPTSCALLQRVGLRRGMRCLDAGCGSADLALHIASVVAREGRVVGTDIDSLKIDLARQEAANRQVTNIEFQLANICDGVPDGAFDLIHARFLLTHLPDPELALHNMREALLPGGVVVVEDIDFSGYFCYPECAAFRRYVELYTKTVRCLGGDANIGPRLPSLLAAAGFENIQLNVVQPVGIDGEIKMVAALTMEHIADSVIAEDLASPGEISEIVGELSEFAHTPGTVASFPRIVEAWATVGSNTV
jgi:ubiquinone/menaquinone biosynthesis C-methylase UbiE